MNRYFFATFLSSFFCITGYGAESLIERTENLIERSDRVFQEVFDFVLEHENKSFTIQTEHSLKLLLRALPAKTSKITTSRVQFHTIPAMTTIEMIKRIVQKIKRLEKSYKYIQKKSHSHIMQASIDDAYEQLQSLRIDCEKTIAFIKRTDLYFSEIYSTYNQGESIAMRSIKGLFGIIVALQGVQLIVDFVLPKYMLYKDLNNSEIFN